MLSVMDSVQLLKINLMAKSKSKTFPKGTDIADIGDFVCEQIPTSIVEGRAFSYDAINEKYLITITKLPEKGKKE